MSDSLAVIVAVCGMLVVLAGLFLLLILQVVRFGRRNALMSIVQFMGGRGEDAEEDQYTPLPEYKAPSPTDLRAKAEALDFDAAVQKYRQQSSSSNSTPSATAQSTPAPLSSSQPFTAQTIRPGSDLSNSKSLNPAPLSSPLTPSSPASLPPLTPGKLSQRLSQDNRNPSDRSSQSNRQLRRSQEEEDEDIMGGLISGEDPDALL